MKSFFVYMLQCWDGSYYVGITSNLEKRLSEHEHGVDPECYTKTRRPVLLVFSESFASADQAIAAEKRLKGWSHAKKRALIGHRWDEVRRLARGGVAARPARSSLTLRQAQGDGATHGDRATSQ